ncbi:hypothetical protein ACHWQZ_G018855 [Mnemiopsis leidyi]
MSIEPDAVSIKVVARFRPFNDKELAINAGSSFKFIGDECVNINGKTYVFDKIFREKATQEDVYTFSAKPIVADILNGYNGTIFAYGQTASGKTHTMEGVLGDPDWQGIIPRIVEDIFNYIYSMEENVEFHIKVSYFEIYMEKIRDLLDTTKTNLPIHEDKFRVPYVKGVTERFVGSPEEIMDVIGEGKSNRAVSVTNMNEHSSRSHSVFQLSISQVNMESQQKLNGKLYLVDLAGSEKVSKTQAEGMTLDEAKNINKSLSSLGNVIAALSEGQSHIPYRDSKMTRVLQESLGGNARTTIVICCSPSSYNESETKSTVLFGTRAKTIKNTVTVNVELTAEEWRARYEKEVEKNKRLKLLLAKCDTELQRWRKGESVSEEEQTRIRDGSESARTQAGFDLSPSPSTASISNLLGVTNASEAERIAFVKERDSLYKALDDKDDEINKQSQIVEKLKNELEDEKQAAALVAQQNEHLGNEMLNIDMEREKLQEEIKQVMAALEQVAANLDEKTEEVESRIKENSRIIAEMDQKTHEAEKAKTSLEQWKQKYNQQISRSAKGITEIIEEVCGISGILGEQIALDTNLMEEDFSKVEEQFTMARVYANKTKTIVESLTQEQRKQTGSYNEALSKIAVLEKSVQDAKLRIEEGESRTASLEQELKDADTRKRKLEEDIGFLNTECARLSELEETRIASMNQGKKEASELKSSLEQQIESTRESYQRQLSSLKEDIADREKQLKNQEQKYLEEQQRQNRLKSMLEEEQLNKDVISKKLKELEYQLELKARARQETRGIEEIANKELANINALRVAFVDDLQSRIKQTNTQVSEDDSSTIERQRIAFLENNLDQLTNVHKQLVRDNSELRCELPKMERRLMAKIERVKQLEVALKESKERGIEDRQRMQKEIEQMKSWTRLRKQPAQKTSAHIAKPIRSGQRGQSISSEASAVIRNTPEKAYLGVRRHV